MATRRRRKKSGFTPVQRFAIIGVCLIGLEGVIYAFFPTPHPPSAKDAIAKAIDQVGNQVDDQRREQLRIQIAVQQYQVANGGKPPATLDLLVPTFLERIPLDPTTQKPFEYRVENNKAFVGPGGQKKPAPGTALASKPTIDIFNIPEEDEKARFVYDPAGKRDPFRVFDFTPRLPTGSNLTQLEKYDLGQLKLTAVLKGFDEPQAIVENQAGKGFPVKKGTKIGMNNGVIADILPDKILILETEIDFTGQKKQNVVEMTLRTKGDTEE